jgi:hypothetical protein
MMVRRGLLPMVLLLSGIGIQAAQASGDFGCSLSWSLKRDQLDACNSLPFLSPANDSRVNLRLLLADQGLEPLPDQPVSQFDEQMGYGLVPFSIDRLSGPQDGAPTGDSADGTTDGTTVVETPAAPSAADAAAAALADLAKQIGVTPEATGTATADTAANLFASGEGSRCASNDDATARTFLEQLVASTELPDAERKALARGRLALLGACTWDQAQQAAIAPQGVQSPLGKQFADYLQGAMAFYAGDFPAATRAFTGLAGSGQAWLKETAGYMAARTLLNQAQANSFDDMGYPKLENVDQPTLDAAEKAFDQYLQAYPSGLYAGSAQGLLRRVAWLRGDRTKLAAEYAALLARPNTPPQSLPLDALVQEADNKLLTQVAPADVTDPHLLAVLDLMQMRHRDPGADGTAFALADLQAQKPRFISDPTLYGYLVSAFHFYVEADADKTLQGLPDALPTAAPDYLEFSRQTLRGFALEAKGDWAGAQDLWLKLMPLVQQQPLQRAQLDLALAMNYERSGRLATVFAPDSPIQTPQIRQILLRNLAGPALLRQQAKAARAPETEQDTALFTLLYKDLLRGHYRDFGSDLALLPDPLPEKPSVPWDQSLSLFHWDGKTAESDYTCPSIRDIAATLQRSAGSPEGLNCLGEFILRNGLDSYSLDHQPDAQDLGGTATEFPGKIYSRLDGYMQVIGDSKASRNDRAYALYRAINCFAPSQNNGCGPQDIPTAQRKQWFQTLKSRYPNTSWAKTLKYYW